jgi:L,D-transpeptidase catalytic domain
VGRAAGALVAAGVLVAGCGGTSSKPDRRPVAKPRAAKPGAATPRAVASSTPVKRIDGTVVPGGRGHLTAWVRRPVLLRARPAGRAIARLTPRTEFTTPRVMPVMARRGRWLGVISSKAPDNRLGWVAASRVSLYRVPFSIDVSLGRRRVVVSRDGKAVERFAVGIGTAATPTPTGRFAVTDKLLTRAAGGPYGCCILALSGHQPHLREGWQGGDRIAMHGTDAPASIGQAASNGCLRAPERAMARAVRLVPIGTIVRIRS